MNSVLNRISRNSMNVGTPSPFAERVDGLVTRFVDEASSPTTLGALTAGGIAYRFGRMGVMGLNVGAYCNTPLRVASIAVGLGSEVTAFEFTNRTFLTLRAHGRAPLQIQNPNLWSWSGPGGLWEGLFSSAITFGMLKSAGSLAREENLVFQHAFQSSAMVAGHQISAGIGLTLKPQEGLAEQFLHAEVTNLQLSAGMGLAYRMAPGLHAVEKGMDLSLQGHEIFDVGAHGRAPIFSVATALADSGINLHTQEMGLPTRFKQGILQTSGSGDSGSETKKTNPSPKPAPTEDAEQVLKPEKIHLVALGDIHSQWTDVQKILDHEFPEGNGTAIAVGDLETYPRLERGHQIHFIHGNHDDVPLLRKMRAGEIPSNQNYHPFFAGDLVRLGGLTMAGLPGNFSPKFFEKPRNAPLKHFLPLHFDKTRLIQSPLDIFLIHEAPKDVGFRKGGKDLGIPFLTGLIEYLQPRLVFFGHHHRRFEGQIGETRIVGLDHPGRSYVTLDYDLRTDHLELREQVSETIDPSRRLFQFSWEQGKKEESRSLFGGGIPLEKEKRIVELLETRHREGVIDSLEKILLTETEGKDAEEKAFRARTRAALAVNEALPFVARYAARLEEKPDLSLEEKKKILGEIFEKMTPDSAPTEISDDVRAFGEFLKILKIS